MNENIDEEKPPIAGTWRNLYILVMVVFAVLVSVFYIITKIY